MIPAQQALTIRQPWATLFVKGVKPVENRVWAISEARLPIRIYVHAGAATTELHSPDVAQFVKGCLGDDGFDRFADVSLPLGAIIGKATIVSCVRTHPSPWFVGPWGWVFENVIEYVEPIPLRGQQGLFKVTAADLRSAREATPASTVSGSLLCAAADGQERKS